MTNYNRTFLTNSIPFTTIFPNFLQVWRFSQVFRHCQTPYRVTKKVNKKWSCYSFSPGRLWPPWANSINVSSYSVVLSSLLSGSLAWWTGGEGLGTRGCWSGSPLLLQNTLVSASRLPEEQAQNKQGPGIRPTRYRITCNPLTKLNTSKQFKKTVSMESVLKNNTPFCLTGCQRTWETFSNKQHVKKRVWYFE